MILRKDLFSAVPRDFFPPVELQQEHSIRTKKSDHLGCRLKINIKEINKYEREIRMVEEKDLQAAGAFREEKGRGKRVEKSSGKGECNA